MKGVPLINDVSLYVVNNLSVFTTDVQEAKIKNIRLEESKLPLFEKAGLKFEKLGV